MSAVKENKGGFFFIYGYGGTGKTFVWRALSAALRSQGNILFIVASSGIAAQLLPGGTTAHSKFAIPINVDEYSTCNVKQGTQLAELLAMARLIIWDEAPMTHKHCFEALDRSLRDIMRFHNHNSMTMPFGGKVVVLGGDFRQILPVIPKGSREDIVYASLNYSYLWSFCKVLTLTKNMRLFTTPSSSAFKEVEQFSDWILHVGNGTLSTNNDDSIEIADDLLVKKGGDPISDIVNSTYPSFLQHLDDLSYLRERAILAPTLHLVNEVNDRVLSLINAEERIFLSSDNICTTEDTSSAHNDLYTPEFLNAIEGSGLPNHMLRLKCGSPIILLRNIDKSVGLCNGTRLVLTQMGNHVLQAKILSGFNVGEKVLIPRMVITPSNKRIPFKFQRRQFSIALSFAMTINKSQGQSLTHVGLYLPRPVFTHGQLYVAISRVKTKDGLKVLITDDDGNRTNVTQNIVYRESFDNLLPVN